VDCFYGRGMNVNRLESDSDVCDISVPKADCGQPTLWSSENQTCVKVNSQEQTN